MKRVGTGGTPPGKKRKKKDDDGEWRPRSVKPKPKKKPVLKKSKRTTQAKKVQFDPLAGAFTPQVPAVGPKLPAKLVAGAHDLRAGQVVRLHPRVELAQAPDGTKWVQGLLISRLQRTPSPFGNRMGDHTIAWQVVVDSVRASLYGMTVPQAATMLQQMQLDAGAWMGDPTSPGFQLLKRLERIDSQDAVNRVTPLEDAAFQVDKLCKEALAEKNPDKAAKKLADAVAQHLAYLNYLPFSTVPAASARGSKGSGEGTYRRTLLNYEKKGAGDLTTALVAAQKTPGSPLVVPKPTREETRALTEAMWSMFAFDATLREANVDYALNPFMAQVTSDHVKELKAINAELDAALQIVAGRKGGTARVAAAEKIIKTTVPRLQEIQKSFGVLQSTHKAAGSLKTKADDVVERLAEAPSQNRAYTAKLRMEKPEDKKVMAEAERVANDIMRISGESSAHAVDVLSDRLYEHVRRMAAAYPHSVSATGLPPSTDGWFGEAAANMLVSQLDRAIREEMPGLFSSGDPVSLDTLKKNVAGRLARKRAIPVTPQPYTWATNAAGTNMVVSFDAQKREPLTIDGRPPAPPGVEGMGAHTTAWITETMHVNAMLTGLSAKAALNELQSAVKRDLNSRLMELDVLLPNEQIQARQLAAVFDEAYAVLNAKDVAQAATSYLSFRNLLPYATVDDGGRAGKAESRTADVNGSLDSDVLVLAADRKKDELAADPDRARQVLLDEVALLEKDLERWNSNTDLVNAVRTSQERLKGMVNRLAKPSSVAREATQARKLIHDTRKGEHASIWKEAQKVR